MDRLAILANGVLSVLTLFPLSVIEEKKTGLKFGVLILYYLTFFRTKMQFRVISKLY